VAIFLAGRQFHAPSLVFCSMTQLDIIVMSWMTAVLMLYMALNESEHP